MNSQAQSLGSLIETPLAWIFFGNKNSQITALQEAFPQFRFKRIKQVHGDKIIHTSPHSIDFSTEADAHYTNEKGLALAVATADCAPVMLIHQNPNWVVSIHAGWRGVEKRIVPKAIKNLVRMGCHAKDIQVFVGPHIQKPSFEVGNDVRDQLLNSFKGSKQNIAEALSADKSLIDLNQILKMQLAESDILLENCNFEMKDTVKDLNYHSHRRDKENAGRQLSFIVLK